MKIIWPILALLVGAVLWSSGQTEVKTETVTLTTVVSNDWVSVAHVQFHNGSNYNLLMPMTVTNTYLTGFGAVRLSTTNGPVSTNICEARFEPMVGPGPQWSLKTPNLPTTP